MSTKNETTQNFQIAYDSLMKLAGNAKQGFVKTNDKQFEASAKAYEASASLINGAAAASGILLKVKPLSNKDYFLQTREDDYREEQANEERLFMLRNERRAAI